MDKKRITEELETVMDPEIGLDLVTLGLIYDIDFKEDLSYAKITMTYTTPMCPFGPVLNQNVSSALYDLGFKAAEIDVTFDPPWEPPENLREMMGV